MIAMAFFKPTPNLPAGEKARIEFHLQQIAECIGFDRFKLPVLSEDSVLTADSQSILRSADEVMNLVGNQLGHDVTGITIQSEPLPPEKSGGGG